MEDTKPRSVIEKLKILPTVIPELDDVQDEEEYEDPDSYQAFVSTRQSNRRAEMLELVFKDGKRESFAYSHLYRTSYHPDESIVLRFTEHIVRIVGSRLLPGLRRIQNQRLQTIVEADAPTRLIADTTTSSFIVSITISRQERESDNC